NRRIIYLNQVWRPARALHPLIGSRRKWREECERLDWCEGCIVYPDGTPCRLDPPAYDIFERGNKWMSEFLRADHTGRRPLIYKENLERVRRVHLVIELWKAEGNFPDPARISPGLKRPLR
ncbi:MAG: hypothetical protein AAGA69_07130, partial [Pseudomonadota bacterium]